MFGEGYVDVLAASEKTLSGYVDYGQGEIMDCPLVAVIGTCQKAFSRRLERADQNCDVRCQREQGMGDQ